MEGAFVRPTTVPKRVWSRFKSFRIEDIPDERQEEVFEYMKANYFKEEPTSTVLMKKYPFSEEDKINFLKNSLKENMSLFAVDEDNNDEIAGVTMLRVVSRAVPHKHDPADSSLKSMKAQFTFLAHCLKGLDKFTYDSGPSGKVVVDHVLEPMGLSVSSQYRGKGIGLALIEARHKMSIEMGIKATMGIYTSIYSQAILLHAGMKTIKEVPYADYLHDGVAIFAELNPPHPSTKVIAGLL